MELIDFIKHLYLVLFLFSSFSSYAELKLNVERTEYEFDANSIEQMVQKVRELGPKSSYSRAWALLETEVVTKFSVITTEKGCQFYAPEINVVALMTLPHWRNIDELAPETKLWWQSYSSYLLGHENEHLEIAVKSAEKMFNKLNREHVGFDCKQLREKFLGYKGTMMSQVRIADSEFDREDAEKTLKQGPLFIPLTPFLGKEIEIERIRRKKNSWIPESVR